MNFTYLTETDDQYKDLDIDANVTIDIGPLAAEYEIVNTQSSDISELFISTAYAGPRDVNIGIDRGATTNWNQIAIINHDGISSSSTFTIKSGTTSSALDHSDSMTWREFDMYFQTAATRTDRYLIIVIHDADTSSHSISIGRIMVGQAVTLAKQFRYGWHRRRIQANRTQRSELGAKMTNALYATKQFTFSWQELSDSELSGLTTFTDALAGDSVQVFIVPYSPTLYHGYMVTLATQSVDEIFNFNRELGDLTFDEATRGTRISA